jgi:hypothetical protein
MEQFFVEVERRLGTYTRQHRSRLRNTLRLLRDDMKLGSIEELVDNGLEDRFKQLIRRKGLTDSQEESRLKGLHAIWSYGEEQGYFESPPFGPVRKGAGKRGPLKGHSGREPTVADFHRLWMRLDRGKESFAGGRLRITVCMVGFVGLSLEAARNLRQSQIVDDGSGITYESRYWKGTRHKFLSQEIADILAEWLGNAEFGERSALSAAGDRWLVPNNRGEGPWARDSNPPEHPVGHLEAACTAEGLERMTFEDLHVLHKNHKITGPSHLFELASRSAVGRSERRPTVVIGEPHENVVVFGVDQGQLPPQQYAVLKGIFDAGEGGVLLSDLHAVAKYPGERVSDLMKRSDEFRRLIIRTDACPGSPARCNFSQWWIT